MYDTNNLASDQIQQEEQLVNRAVNVNDLNMDDSAPVGLTGLKYWTTQNVSNHTHT